MLFTIQTVAYAEIDPPYVTKCAEPHHTQYL